MSIFDRDGSQTEANLEEELRTLQALLKEGKATVDQADRIISIKNLLRRFKIARD